MDIATFKEKTKGLEALDLMQAVAKEFKDQVVLASSTSIEDQVLTHMISKVTPSIKILVLDTGRLHQETYTTLDETKEKLGVYIQTVVPDTKDLEAFLEKEGHNPFYKSVALRKLCCKLRKVDPLNRALKGKKAWITGMRRAQSVTRSHIETVMWDEAHNMVKINPLAHWTQDQVWAYIKQHDVPHNPLQTQGFASIGCVPCTRAIKEGEDERAGRWWWEEPEQKECGLHVVNGKLERKKDGLSG